MPKTCLALLFLLFFNDTYSQDTTKILFIGNSLTYYNRMPQMVRMMFEESGKAVRIYQRTDPGMNIKTHLELMTNYGGTLGEKFQPSMDKLVQEKLIDIWGSITPFQLSLNTFQEIHFDYVILQEATIRLLIPHLREDFFEIMHAFRKAAEMSGGKLLFYQPYPTYKYPKTYCFPNPESKEGFSCADELTDSEQELSIYSRLCTEIMAEDSVQIVPIGRAFEESRKAYPSYNLLSDEQHPSRLGSYLIAYTVYRSIVKENYLKEFSFIQDVDKSTLKGVFDVVDKVIRKGRY